MGGCAVSSRRLEGGRGMRKVFALVVLVAAVAIPVTAHAVDLSDNGIGYTLRGTGSWHFVLNQGGRHRGQLRRSPVNGIDYGTPDMVVANGKVGHWTIEFSGNAQQREHVRRRAAPTVRLGLQEGRPLEEVAASDLDGRSRGPGRAPLLVTSQVGLELVDRSEHHVGERERVVGRRVAAVGDRDRRACPRRARRGSRSPSPRPPRSARVERRGDAPPRGRRRAQACRARPPRTTRSTSKSGASPDSRTASITRRFDDEARASRNDPASRRTASTAPSINGSRSS